MRGFRLILLAWVASGCSLLVHFDPETQPCDSAGLCGPGYSCTDAGLCHFTDAGSPPTDAGNLDGAVCIAHETNCADGKDDDCDNLTDCLDPDCSGLRCDDKDGCTTGETCNSSGVCVRGTAVVCNTPGPCQATNGSCTAGACVYAALADGTVCGPLTSARCCTGSCINVTLNGTNCGGCSLACAMGQVCQPVNQETACMEPIDTSGRCSCNTGAPCPGGQTCASNGFCRPATTAQCAPGQSLGDGGVSCGPYCRY